jgi:hypothetical protein
LRLLIVGGNARRDWLIFTASAVETTLMIFRDLIGDCDMPLINVALVLIVVGVLLWLVNRFIPMQGTIKGILNAVVTIVVVLWLLNIFGLYHYVTQFRVGSQ